MNIVRKFGMGSRCESYAYTLEMNTLRPGLPRTGYLTLSPIAPYLPLLITWLKQTSPEGRSTTNFLATGGSGAPRTMMLEKVSDPLASYGERLPACMHAAGWGFTDSRRRLPPSPTTIPTPCGSGSDDGSLRISAETAEDPSAIENALQSSEIDGRKRRPAC